MEILVSRSCCGVAELCQFWPYHEETFLKTVARFKKHSPGVNTLIAWAPATQDWLPCIPKMEKDGWIRIENKFRRATWHGTPKELIGMHFDLSSIPASVLEDAMKDVAKTAKAKRITPGKAELYEF